jgi:hypothetical protein
MWRGSTVLCGKTLEFAVQFELTGEFRGKQDSFHCPGEVNG